MGLLDDIAKGHGAKRAEVDEKAEARKKAEADAKAAAEAEAKKKDEKRAAVEAGIQRGHRPWVGDPDYAVAGLHEGGVFEFVDCGELDGRYVVVKVEVTRNQGRGEPRLWAARDDGEPPKPPYIQMYESAVREEIGFERLKVISAIPKEKIVEAEPMSERDRDAVADLGSKSGHTERPPSPVVSTIGMPAPIAPMVAPTPRAPMITPQATPTAKARTPSPERSSILRPIDDD